MIEMDNEQDAGRSLEAQADTRWCLRQICAMETKIGIIHFQISTFLEHFLRFQCLKKD